MSMLNLNPRQEAFCQAIFEGRSARQAALEAGYSSKSASSIGADLMKLPKVAARIQELREAEHEAREADRRVARTRDVILSRLTNIGRDMEPVTICGSDGFPAGIFLPFSSLAKAILSN